MILLLMNSMLVSLPKIEQLCARISNIEFSITPYFRLEKFVGN
jgi:hypothetical protein